MSGRSRSILVLAAVVLTLGCKPGKTVIPERASETWSDMDAGERQAHMAAVVVPRMQAVFQEFDAKRFADFGCPTCHGQGAGDGSYAMPNPALIEIDPRGTYKKHRKESPEIAKLMWERVEPEMAALLGERRYLVSRDRGFQCGRCHVLVQ